MLKRCLCISSLINCAVGLCEQNTLTRHNVSHDIGSSVCARYIIHVSCAFVFDLSSTLHFALFICLSHRLLHPPDLSLHLLCGSVRSKTPCALPRMRSLALGSTSLLSQVMSPTSSTTTTTQRPLKFSSRSPPATPALVPA